MKCLVGKAQSKTCDDVQIASPTKQIFDECINEIQHEHPNIQLVTSKTYPILECREEK